MAVRLVRCVGVPPGKSLAAWRPKQARAIERARPLEPLEPLSPG